MVVAVADTGVCVPLLLGVPWSMSFAVADGVGIAVDVGVAVGVGVGVDDEGSNGSGVDCVDDGDDVAAISEATSTGIDSTRRAASPILRARPPHGDCGLMVRPGCPLRLGAPQRGGSSSHVP